MPAALLVGGAILGSAVISSNATRRATNAATAAQQQNIALANSTRDANVALSQPTVDRGNTASETISALLGLSGDHSAQDAAFQHFLGSTNYQFQVNQGTQAIRGNRATQGLLNSGATLRALDAYGQNMGRGAITDYLGQLGTVANRGLSAIGDVTAANNNNQNAVTNANNANADAIGNGALTQANTWSNAFSNLASLGSYGLGQSSYGGAKKAAGAGGGGGGGSNPFGVFAI
jgi:hypothetical protein